MISRSDLDIVIGNVNTRMQSHGGGIELTSVTDNGHVSVRFTGMCCGCPYKALTWRGTVRPMLEKVRDVTGLEAPGVRISEEAEQRLRRYVATEYIPEHRLLPSSQASYHDGRSSSRSSMS